MKDLERRLVELGHSFDDADPPEVASRVAARLREPTRPNRRLRRVALVALAMLAAVLAVAVSPAGTSLLELFDLGGVEVERVEALPPVQPRGKLAPGAETTLDRARSQVPFPLYLPPEAPEPAHVFLNASDPPGGEVTLVYGSRSRPRLLISEFVASDLGPLKYKKAGPQTTVERTMVNGAPALWLGGATHEFSFVDGDGTTRGFQTRLAARTLIWVRDGVTIRLEGDLSRDEAIALAGTFAPAD